jgi:hypothetical protein
MIGIPCFFLREKTAQSYQHVRGNDGAERERREWVIACTMIEYADAATGKKMASICQWCGGWGTAAMRSPEFHA